MGTKLTDIIRSEFEQKKEMSLKELYDAVTKNSDINIQPHILPTRVRSVVQYLLRRNEITRVKKTTFKVT